MTKKILAMTLCLALTLLACACAASNATVSAPESTDSKCGNTPDLSTMEQPGTSPPVTQMSSQPPFSDAVSTPTEPILPEEKETTLELIASCIIGTEGAFEYGFTFYDDPSTAILEIGGQIYTDGNGNFYQVYRGSLIVCVNNGERLPTLHKGQVLDVVICGNSFYVLTAEGNVYKYDISNGFENCTFAKEHPIFKKHEELAKFGPIVDGRPTVQYYAKDGTVWYPDGPYYTLEKEKLPDSKLQSFFVYVESRQDMEPIQVVSDEFKGWAVSEDAYSVLSATSEIIVLRENNTPKGISIFVSYDANGNLLSRHAMYKGEAAKTSCERPFEQGGSHLLKEVLSYSYTIDTTVFDGLVNHLILRDSAGNQYFAAYYLDRCDVYRINPGYSDRDYVTE